MLAVVEVRDGIFEISDLYLDEDRNQIKLFQNLSMILGVLGILLLFFVIFSSTQSSIKIIIVLTSLMMIGVGSFFSLKYRDLLNDSISGFLLVFNEEQQLVILRVRRWIHNQVDQFAEEDIRFNQAIGFQVLLNEDGDLIVDIIVDPSFPGTSIFRTYDFATLAEIILLFQKVLPDQDKWYYKLTDGNDWDTEYKSELNNEIQIARVPWQIRKYYGF